MLSARDFSVQNGKVIIDRGALAKALADVSAQYEVSEMERSAIIPAGPDLQSRAESPWNLGPGVGLDFLPPEPPVIPE